MHVYSAVFRYLEHIIRQYAPVSDNDKNIGPEAFYKLGSRSVAQLCRLINGNIVFQCKLLYRTVRKLHAAVARLVRLSENGCNIVFFIYKLF